MCWMSLLGKKGPEGRREGRRERWRQEGETLDKVTVCVCVCPTACMLACALWCSIISIRCHAISLSPILYLFKSFRRHRVTLYSGTKICKETFSWFYCCAWCFAARPDTRGSLKEDTGSDEANQRVLCQYRHKPLLSYQGDHWLKIQVFKPWSNVAKHLHLLKITEPETHTNDKIIVTTAKFTKNPAGKSCWI